MKKNNSRRKFIKFGLATTAMVAVGLEGVTSLLASTPESNKIKNNLLEVSQGGLPFLLSLNEAFKTIDEAKKYAVKFLKKSIDRKSTRLNSSHIPLSRMPSSA